MKKTGENKAFLDADHFDQDDDLETSLTRISKICKQVFHACIKPPSNIENVKYIKLIYA